MLDAHREHQRSAPAVLGHLARGVAVALHEGHEPCRGQRRVLHRRPLRTDVGEVVPHAAAALHQLHLLLVDLDDASVGVGLTLESYHEAVGERAHLVVVADAGHRASLRHYIPEALEKAVDLPGAHGVGILALYARYLVGDAVVHVVGSGFKKMTVGVFKSVFRRPYSGGELVALEILERRGIRFIVGIGFSRCHWVVAVAISKPQISSKCFRYAISHGVESCRTCRKIKFIRMEIREIKILSTTGSFQNGERRLPRGMERQLSAASSIGIEVEGVWPF